jgi:hypothetical protein
MHWLIIRTDFRKEHYVAQQIRNAGFDAWVPVQIIMARKPNSRRIDSVARYERKELPILPRRLFAAVPVALQAELEGVRHLVAIERNGQQEAICVPANQLHAFRVEIDKENAAAMALSQTASKRQKKKWKSLHDALVELIDGAKAELEQAA